MYYYQVGGLGSQTVWFGYDTRKLSNFIFSALTVRTGEKGDVKKASLELLLGISSTGSSYLLVSESQMDIILRYGGQTTNLRRPSYPRSAAEYASLSPINFHSPGELQSKLKTYTQNSKSSKKAGRDTSKANTMYDQANLTRPAFEHQRLLWSAIQSPIDIDKFALCESPVWIASTSFVALAMQTWLFDPIEKRKKDPTVLSLDLASIRCIAFEGEDYANQISHTISVKIEEHTMFNGPNTSPANSRQEVVKKTELSRRLNNFFASIDSKQALLLVYDAEQARNSLQKLGIDVSSYQDGIATLLYGQTWQQGSRLNGTDNRTRGYRERFHSTYQNSRERSNSQIETRRRSRSPHRQSPYIQRPRSPPLPVHRGNHHSPSTQEGAAPEDNEVNEEEEEEEDTDAPPPPAKVYIIDVKALFLAVSKFEPHAVSGLQDLATKMGIPEALGGSHNGNDCRLLIEAWKRMASGKAIDEQYDEHWSLKAISARGSQVKPNPSSSRVEQNQEPARSEANSDEENDPNDVIVDRNNRPRPLVVAGGLRPPTDDYDTDDSDYE